MDLRPASQERLTTCRVLQTCSKVHDWGDDGPWMGGVPVVAMMTGPIANSLPNIYAHILGSVSSQLWSEKLLFTVGGGLCGES